MATASKPRTSARPGLAPTVVFPLLTAVVLGGCGTDSADPTPDNAAEAAGPNVLHGPEVALGNGTARTYVVLEGSTPIEVGVTMSEEVLAGLPPDGAPGGMMMPDGHSTFENVLDMPANNPTPFRHVTLDWNPAGHEPPGVYDRPHFDIHFFTISNDDRLTINPGHPEFGARAARMPPAEQIPAGYIDPQIGPVPLMGVHWVDPTSPELAPENPATFTRTLIYGSWDGKMIFIEPMVSVEFLMTRPDERLPLPVATRYDPAGYYPESYVIQWNEAAREYRIALADLRMRQ
ncbi:MAG TPA: DUF5602 domain-containing protein [Longimicrobiaceae bacterium]|nr:DUF5602 domain-containing protein [Longimicrobiaceae bacterium]